MKFNFGKFFAWSLRATFIALCLCVCADTAAHIAGVNLPILAFVPPMDVPSMMFIGMGPIVLADFPTDPEQQRISLAYRNTRLIANSVLPRRIVGKQAFKYNKFPEGQFITVPSSIVSRTGTPTELELGFEAIDSSTIDHGYDALVPNADVVNAPDNYDPIGAHTEYLTDILMLDREIRVANMVFDPANYAAANKTTLSGNSQFSHASSTPISAIEDGCDACFQRPNKMVFGRAAFKAFSMHASIVAACNGNSGEKGKANKAQIAELFEMDEVLVGEGWVNVARPGQTPVKARVWGKSVLLLYANPVANLQLGVTFGLTAEFGTRVAGPMAEPKAGLRGAVRNRVGESVREVLMCPDCAFLFDAAVA